MALRFSTHNTAILFFKIIILVFKKNANFRRKSQKIPSYHNNGPRRHRGGKKNRPRLTAELFPRFRKGGKENCPRMLSTRLIAHFVLFPSSGANSTKKKKHCKF
jgi:hypothetical protein